MKPWNEGSILNSTASSLCRNIGAIPSNVAGVDWESTASSAEVSAGGGELRRESMLRSKVKREVPFAPSFYALSLHISSQSITSRVSSILATTLAENHASRTRTEKNINKISRNGRTSST